MLVCSTTWCVSAATCGHYKTKLTEAALSVCENSMQCDNMLVTSPNFIHVVSLKMATVSYLQWK